MHKISYKHEIKNFLCEYIDKLSDDEIVDFLWKKSINPSKTDYWNTIPIDVLGLILKEFDNISDFKTLCFLNRRTLNCIYTYFNFINLTDKQLKKLISNIIHKRPQMIMVINNKSISSERIGFAIARWSPQTKKSNLYSYWNKLLRNTNTNFDVEKLFEFCTDVLKNHEQQKHKLYIRVKIIKLLCSEIIKQIDENNESDETPKCD